jgi:phosphotransferase system HPr-like phosphotransfer protein
MDRRALALRTISDCERSGHLSDAEVEYLRQDRADAASVMALERVAARYAARVQFRQRKKEARNG